MPERFFKSEDGQYLCRLVGSWGSFEAWTVDGCLHWRHDNRYHKWSDQGKYNRPMAYSVGGYSAEQVDQKKGSFTLSLMRCDTTKVIEPFKGNTVMETLDVVFRRRVSYQQLPRWIKAIFPKSSSK